MPRNRVSAFTLIELLVVVAIISLLIGILLPSLSAARAQGRGAVCLAQLRSLGQGLTMYTTAARDVYVPGRLPKLDACNWYADISGGKKYRPTFMAMMSLEVGTPAFAEPLACADQTDSFGQPGDRQDYASRIYVCPETGEWTDERNGSYGYNYQFLGNSRLRKGKFTNWPVRTTQIRDAARTVAAGDSMGTAASFGPAERTPYENGGKTATSFGNEGFNLDPPRIDGINGEMAGFDDAPQHRSGVDDRHRGRAAILWVDGHASAQTPAQLGYDLDSDGSFNWFGDNSLWSGSGQDVAWTTSYHY